MVSEKAMAEFKERLEHLQSIDHIALARIFDVNTGKLISVVPNLPGKSGSLKILNSAYDSVAGGRVDSRRALKIFGDELVEEAQGDKHYNIQVLGQAIMDGRSLRIETVSTINAGLLQDLVDGKASRNQKFEAACLLQSGRIRTAEKTHGIDCNSPMWEAQAYAIAAVNGAFGLFEMRTFPGMPQYIDKLPLWTQAISLGEGVNSEYRCENDLKDSGVRLIPGSFARMGAYIGKGTTIMPGGIVNIGAYIAGEGVMVDGGSRVGSGAQVGKGVKIGAGTGLEGVLEPAGIIPTIVEDGVRIGANCEITGIIGEGALIASGVVMAKGKKIYDERTNSFVEPLYVNTAEGIKSVPHIPAGRIAVGGVYIPEGARVGKDIVILLEKDAKDSSFMDIPKNPSLYQR